MSQKAWMNAYTKGSKSLQARLSKIHAHNPEFQDFVSKHGFGGTLSVKQSEKQKVHTLTTTKPEVKATVGPVDRLAVIKAAFEKKRDRNAAASNRASFGGSLGGETNFHSAGFRRYSESLDESKVVDKILAHPAVEYYGGKDDSHFINLKKGWHMGDGQRSFSNENAGQALKELKRVVKFKKGEAKEYGIDEGAMPSSIIKTKQKFAEKSPEELRAAFKEVSDRTGKSVEDVARSTARRHGHTAGWYVSRMKEEVWNKTSAERGIKPGEVDTDTFERDQKILAQRKSRPYQPNKPTFASGMRDAAAKLKADRAEKTDEEVLATHLDGGYTHTLNKHGDKQYSHVMEPKSGKGRQTVIGGKVVVGQSWEEATGKKLKEEVLTELSKYKLKTYKKAARADWSDALVGRGRHAKAKRGKGLYGVLFNKEHPVEKRERGMKMATNKLMPISKKVKIKAQGVKTISAKRQGELNLEEVHFGDASYTMRRSGWVVNRGGKTVSAVLPSEQHAKEFITRSRKTLGYKLGKVLRDKAADIAHGLGRSVGGTMTHAKVAESAQNRNRIRSWDSAMLPPEHDHPLTSRVATTREKVLKLRANGKHVQAREIERKALAMGFAKEKALAQNESTSENSKMNTFKNLRDAIKEGMDADTWNGKNPKNPLITLHSTTEKKIDGREPMIGHMHLSTAAGIHGLDHKQALLDLRVHGEHVGGDKKVRITLSQHQKVWEEVNEAGKNPYGPGYKLVDKDGTELKVGHKFKFTPFERSKPEHHEITGWQSGAQRGNSSSSGRVAVKVGKGKKAYDTEFFPHVFDMKVVKEEVVNEAGKNPYGPGYKLVDKDGTELKVGHKFKFTSHHEGSKPEHHEITGWRSGACDPLRRGRVAVKVGKGKKAYDTEFFPHVFDMKVVKEDTVNEANHTHQVVYTVPGEGKQKQYYHVTADDEAHAREQLMDAEPKAKIHKVEPITKNEEVVNEVKTSTIVSVATKRYAQAQQALKDKDYGGYVKGMKKAIKAADATTPKSGWSAEDDADTGVFGGPLPHKNLSKGQQAALDKVLPKREEVSPQEKYRQIRENKAKSARMSAKWSKDLERERKGADIYKGKPTKDPYLNDTSLDKKTRG